jgi:ubiquinone/menaquinone biosynthesis C-methylase UbiE
VNSSFSGKSAIDKGTAMVEKELFDEWPERYNQWFMTPIGKLIKKIESDLIKDLSDPFQGETILDAGCGTGIFTVDFLATAVKIVGLDISVPMLNLAIKKTNGDKFSAVRGDMTYLPFKDNSFDNTISITALEFIADAKSAISELFRVTRPGGYVVVATLNSLSPWATRRKRKIEMGQKHILEKAFFRSPKELLDCTAYSGFTKTVIHFQKDDDPDRAIQIEQIGQFKGLDTGAFVAARWQKTGFVS